ncbi:MAG TPA: Hpt domain-containing protein, partial [Chloroflexota bacterium]|nr:Hpt domain-containing protein [Chloroflexota bacterium]
MATNAPSGKDRYRARFLTELDGRIDAIFSAATTLRAAELHTLPPEEPDGGDPLSAAVDEMYRHAHSIRGAAGTLGIEEAREAADILAEVVLHLSEEGMLGDGPAWELIFRAAEGLAVFGAACRTGQDTGGTALADGLPQLRRDFERRFAPPEDAADDFAEVARVLRLTDDEIAAFRFPTQHAQPAPLEAATPVTAGQAPADAPDASPTGTLPSPLPEPTERLPSALDEPPIIKQSEVISTPLASEPSDPVALVFGQKPADAEGDGENDAPVQSLPPAESRMITIFRESSLRMAEQIPPALGNLEADRADMVAMRTLRRVFHTIKGDSRQVGLGELGSLCEAAEDVFDTIFEARQQHPEGDHPVPAEALPLLSHAYDILVNLLRGPLLLEDGLPEPARVVRRKLVDAASAVQQPERLADVAGAADRSAAERRQRLLPTFLAEARHLVDALHGHIDTLGSDPANAHALIGGTRALHTLKGNAASMRIESIARLTHGGESLLERAAATASPISPAQVGLLGDLEGAIRHVIDTVDSGEEYDSSALTALLTALTSTPVDEAPTGSATPTAAAPLLAEPGGSTPAVHLGKVRFTPRSAAPRVPESTLETPEPATVAPAGQPRAGAAPRPLFMPRSSSVPERATTQRRSLTGDITSVHLSEVDTAVDLFGRLVTSRTRISRGVQDLQRPASESVRNSQRLRGIIDKLAAEFEIVRRERRAASQREGWDALELETFDTYAQIMLELGEIISDQEEIAGTLGEGVRRTSLICESDLETTNDLQRSLLGFRLVRLSTLEPRLDQVITATARAVGRQIEWKLRGGSTAVDKTVLDALQEPLLHLLRNAIDHGIEPPEVRAARGKPAIGTLGVEASYGTNSLIVRVSDDGGGIDPENLAATAVRRGVLTADAARSLDARAKLELIWQPGFSTADTVTDISGRGVGLDIVRGAIGRVRGTIALESAVGLGTTFVLTLPLSLSVVRTLALRDGSATVAAPISQIEGIHLVRAENIA